MTVWRTRRLVVTVAALGTALVGSVLTSAPGEAVPGQGAHVQGVHVQGADGQGAATTASGSVRAIRSLTSLTATHRWYEQTFAGLPVIDGYYVVHVDSATGVRSVTDGRRAVPASVSTTPTWPRATAQAAALALADVRAAQRHPTGPKGSAASTTTIRGAHLAVLGGARPALVWAVSARSAEGLTRTLVDARTGEVREVRVLSKSADGRGRVFIPNAVVTLRDESLIDKGDRNQRALVPAYQDVALAHLDGDGMLHGSAARVVRGRGGLAKSATNTFVYLRADDRFEQVNAYHAVDLAQTYLQSLGFRDANNEAQDLIVDTVPDDNSWYDPETDEITFGRGGVDDAEDAEVVWHEYGHAIQDAIVPGFGSTERGGAIGEGFGDYWAVTMSVPSSHGFDLPCVADWDATSYTSGPSHCLRRVDGTKTVADVDGEVHDDGEIWSRALWDIHKALGRTTADRVIIESTYFFSPDTLFAAAARQTVRSARRLYGGSAAAAVTAAFHARGIL